MQILIPYLCVPNTYVHDFAQALEGQKHQVIWGSDNLFYNHWQPDVVASHWAEGYLFSLSQQLGSIRKVKDYHLEELHSNLKQKREKTLILAFVHNVKPRYGKDRNFNSLLNKLFTINYDTAHAFVHLGQESIIELQEFYPVEVYQNKPVLVISHGLNELFRASYPLTSETKPKSDNFRIFVPGKIRDSQELSFIIQAFLKAKIPSKQLIIAGGGPVLQGKNPLKPIKKTAINLLPGVTIFARRLSDQEQYNELVNADIVLAPRLSATNSGIPYLAATYRKRCIAARVGNLPSAIAELQGILFEPYNLTSLVEAMELAYQQRHLDVLSNQPCPTWQEIIQQIENFIFTLKTEL